MPAHQDDSLLSVLMKAGTMGNVQTLIEAMLTIQTQLSELRDNQRKIMKALRNMRVEERARLSDLKKSTQSAVHSSHEELVGHLNDLQESVDDATLDDIDIDIDTLANNSHNSGRNSRF